MITIYYKNVPLSEFSVRHFKPLANESLGTQILFHCIKIDLNPKICMFRLLLLLGFALMCSVHKEPVSRGTAMVISFSGAVTGLVGKN